MTPSPVFGPSFSPHSSCSAPRAQRHVGPWQLLSAQDTLQQRHDGALPTAALTHHSHLLSSEPADPPVRLVHPKIRGRGVGVAVAARCATPVDVWGCGAVLRLLSAQSLGNTQVYEVSQVRITKRQMREPKNTCLSYQQWSRVSCFFVVL